uniref:Tetraspanin n=1 Tax=Cacopsylla melanoneura TaxID=428564 RepID=A0A8D8RDB0_9HEMI
MALATSTIKCVLLVFNFIFALSSLGICFLAFIISSKASSLSDATGGQTTVLASLLIVTSTIVFFVAFFGCCGVVRESHCMIVTYICILFALFLTEASLGAAALLNKSSLEETSQQNLKTMLSDYYDSTDKRTFLDRIQIELHCCGVQSPVDWKGSIPLSCCNLADTKRSYCTSDEIYTTGCQSILVEQAKSLASNVGVVAIMVAFMKVSMG